MNRLPAPGLSAPRLPVGARRVLDAQRGEQRGKQRKTQRGVTLIEILIAVLLFSFGLIGLVGLQAKAIQYAMSAEDSTRASLLANELASSMWMAGTVALDTDVVDDWNARVGNAATGGLPNGQGTLTVAGGVATVTVSWRPHSAASTVMHRYTTQVVIP